MQRASSPYVFPDRGVRRTRAGNILHLLILIFLVSAISFAAVFYSLGYKINPTTHAIERTGLLSIASSSNQEVAEIWIDGKHVGDKIPFRSDPLFPGRYQVEIRRSGYQAWSRLVDIEANRNTAFRYVTLIRETPEKVATTDGHRNFLENYDPDQRNIDVRSNELWADGEFVTRFSSDIAKAEWYPDKAHVAYQLDNQLWLIELVSRHTQLLATLSTSDATSFGFQHDGQLMVYKDGNEVKALELF